MELSLQHVAVRGTMSEPSPSLGKTFFTVERVCYSFRVFQTSAGSLVRLPVYVIA